MEYNTIYYRKSDCRWQICILKFETMDVLLQKFSDRTESCLLAIL